MALAQKAVDKVRKDHGLEINVEVTPRYSSQSLGAVGQFQKQIQAQVRILRLDIQERYGIVLSTAHPAWPWL
eukprot:11332000-Alexandrium_andersonii.AAC.1